MSTRTELVLVLVFSLAFGLCSAIIANCAHAEPTIVKKADLPALKGGKSTAEKSPIPTCFAGNRAKLASSDPLVVDWAKSHEKHACATAATVYVCRAGANLSVRCE